MPYYDSTLIQVYNYTRGWYKMSSGKTLGFALAMPKDYNPSISYPLILSYGGSQTGINDVYGGSSQGMFDADSITYWLKEGSYPYNNGEGYISLALMACQGENGIDPFSEDGIVKMVEEIINSNNLLSYYTKWGTADDGESYAHSGLWQMHYSDNPDTIGDKSLDVFINIDTDRIYYTGFSYGAGKSCLIAYYGRNLLAGIMPYESGIYSYVSFEEFYNSFKGVLSSIDNNRIPSEFLLSNDYYSKNHESVTQPHFWDMENHDFADGSPETSLMYSDGNRKRQIFILEELFKSFKHLPILNIQSWNASGQGPARNAQTLQEALYIWNNVKDETWNTFIAVNSIKNGDYWTGHGHGSQKMWEAVFGELSDGNLHVFDPLVDDINHAVGLSPVLPENKGNKITCLEWLLSQRKSNNPPVEVFDGFPENNFLTVTLSECETHFVFDEYHSIEHHCNGEESLNLYHFIRFEKSGDNIEIRDAYYNILTSVPPNSAMIFSFKGKRYKIIRKNEKTKLITPQKFLI